MNNQLPPAPWKFEPSLNSLVDANGRPIAEILDPEIAAVGEFAARACNEKLAEKKV